MSSVANHQLLKSPKRPWLTRTVLGIGLASLFSDLSHEMATTILPLFMAQHVGASAFALGLIEGLSDGLASFFKLLGGWWTDRTGRRKPIAVAGYTLTAAAVSGLALAQSWTTVLLCRSFAWAARGKSHRGSKCVDGRLRRTKSLRQGVRIREVDGHRGRRPCAAGCTWPCFAWVFLS